MQPEPGINAIRIPRINLADPSTFLRETLTPEEANQRMRILMAKEEALDQSDQKLSPRSLKELIELAEMFSREEGEILFREEIYRQKPSQFYRVVCHLTLEEFMLRIFKKLNQQITSLSNTIVDSSSMAILNSVVHPEQPMLWYQKTMLAQMDVMFRADFIEGLKIGHNLALNLLMAARTLYRDPFVFEEIVRLHASSFDLYEEQIHLNRECELGILIHAKNTQRFLTQMRDLILTCGDKLNVISYKFLEKSNAIVKQEREKHIQLLEVIQNASQRFLDRLMPLKIDFDRCITSITRASNEVAEINAQIMHIYAEKERIEIKKWEIEEQYNQFQRARNQRNESRLRNFFLECNIFENEVILGQADFASLTLWYEFNSVKEEGHRIENEIKRLEGVFKEQLQRYTESGSSAEEFQAAAKALAQAYVAMKGLESTIKVKHEQAKGQMDQIKAQMESTKQLPITNVEEALDYLESIRDKLLHAHAIWLQSNKICLLTHAVRSEEQALTMELIKEITSGGNEVLTKAVAQIELLTANNRYMAEKMPKNGELLQVMNEAKAEEKK